MTPQELVGAQFIWRKENKERNIFSRFKLLGMGKAVWLQGAKKMLRRMQSFGQMLKIQHLPGGEVEGEAAATSEIFK